MASAKTSADRTVRRRRFLGGAAGLLAIPNIAGAQGRKVLTFMPQSDLAILDPMFTAAYVTRHHGMMVFDTLYGMDATYQIQPQMAEGHRVEDDSKTWLITLRDGLQRHDGEKVLGGTVSPASAAGELATVSVRPCSR